MNFDKEIVICMWETISKNGEIKICGRRAKKYEDNEYYCWHHNPKYMLDQRKQASKRYFRKFGPTAKEAIEKIGEIIRLIKREIQMKPEEAFRKGMRAIEKIENVVGDYFKAKKYRQLKFTKKNNL